jgi:hypothetical protein
MPRARRDGRSHLHLVAEAPAAIATPAAPAAPAAPAPRVPPVPSGIDPYAPIAGVPAGLPTGLRAGTPTTADPAGFERDLALIDQVLAIQPVPQEVQVWRAVTSGSFELPWRELPGTLHQEPSYLAVALVRYAALGAAEAVLHLRVPAGIPGVYLNPFDHGDRLPAPTLLLGRGLAVFVHEVLRQDGQWYVRADLLPPPPPGWGRRPRAIPVARDAAAPARGEGPESTAGPTSGPVDLQGRARPHGHLQTIVEEGSGHGR